MAGAEVSAGADRPGAVDVHAHYLPERYREVASYHGHAHPDGMPGLPESSAAAHVELMDRLGVRMAFLSVSSPGVHVGDDVAETRSLARHVNEVAAETIATHPGRFGSFASLPLPDVDAAVDEVGVVLDDLALDGVVLLTNVRGTYLGDASLDTAWRRCSPPISSPNSPITPAACSPAPAVDVGRHPDRQARMAAGQSRRLKWWVRPGSTLVASGQEVHRQVLTVGVVGGHVSMLQAAMMRCWRRATSTTSRAWGSPS